MESESKLVVLLLDKSARRLRNLIEKDDDEKAQLILTLWNKIIQNAIAIELLCRNELRTEALTIQRLSYEHLFNMFALARSESFYDEFINGSQTSLYKAVKSLRNSIKKNGILVGVDTQEKLEKIIAVCDENPVESLGYSIYNAANKSELGHMYDAQYRHLSVTYAHSSALSVLYSHDEDYGSILNDLELILELAYELSLDLWASETIG
ncbi:DUF5677 domain-containing protein [Vibrio harveyi]|uniref:DUF5677 domain-containing protein n=1 Tax=Vibrio harveyi TaxID=669 RepID=UPI0024809BC9|nr:DUF5677 domain-containing protein [Vibrio harveyi]